MTQKFPNHVREHMLRQGVSETQLVEATGLAQSYVNRIKNGRHNPGFPTRAKFAAALGAPAAEIFPLPAPRGLWREARV